MRTLALLGLFLATTASAQTLSGADKSLLIAVETSRMTTDLAIAVFVHSAARADMTAACRTAVAECRHDGSRHLTPERCASC